MDGAGAPVQPPLAGAETQAGGRQYWASGVYGLGVLGAETDGGGLMGRLIAQAQYLRTAWQDYPRDEEQVEEYSQNVL